MKIVDESVVDELKILPSKVLGKVPNLAFTVAVDDVRDVLLNHLNLLLLVLSLRSYLLNLLDKFGFLVCHLIDCDGLKVLISLSLLLLLFEFLLLIDLVHVITDCKLGHVLRLIFTQCPFTQL